ncbi:protein SMAX1-LIKE 6-like isoform X2 [Morus notabilis]|uniref:protein SMAX1-LIKE 6-like isoform X2 n=1 Tax=Morus notabilis TaxID=981085 RepID=UPI000CED339A|nr:protein SMAX1-LIKE 6-like isoform X2 [Morus notabilis]
MPTPVSAARQCLTEEAARALDDAVAVARRRGHAQTTSLHAVSALLALPSSALRDACARARSSAYAPRLQFRALELSVGVSLDRLPSSKTVDEPPVSNSLMAAIKRSQANQRRHPGSFHFHQIHAQQNLNAAVAANQTAPVLRVEMKHFVLSILDDPIVSRVFGEAGFRSCDIKLAILHPPVRQVSPFARARCPPVFFFNPADSDSTARRSSGGLGFSFPFSRHDDGDENSRRIGEVLARNPLLIGVCASEALKSFTEGLQSGKAGLLPSEISGLSVAHIEKDVSEFVVKGGSEEQLDSRFKEVSRVVEQSSGSGVVLNFGELKSWVGNGVLGDRVSSVVSKLKSLLELHSGKLWLIGAAGSDDVYMKFLGPFPSIEKDWDLHLLPITSSKSSTEGIYSKSSLMGSFVPFGGFCPTPSELKNPFSSTNQCFTRCHACTEKYEQEVASILKAGSALSIASPYSENFPSLLMTELDTGKGVDATKTKDGGTALNTRILGLQRKWNEICQRLRHTQSCHKLDIFQAGSKVASAEGIQVVAHTKESSREDSYLNDTQSYSGTASNFQKNFPSNESSFMAMAASPSEKLVKVSESRQIEKGKPCLSPHHVHNIDPPPDRISSSSMAPVTTDLGLGTIYASSSKEPQYMKLQDHKVGPERLPGTYSSEINARTANTSHQIIQSSSRTTPDFKGQFDPRDFKSLQRALIGKVGWQEEAISAISQVISYSRSSGGRHRRSSLRGDIWLTFLGPDKVGKKRIALALAEILYGSRKSLISVDLGSQYRYCETNSIFDHEEVDDYDLKFRGKTVVDYLAGELSRKPHSVVFLENVDKADLPAQISLSQAIRTGKFPDSRGREISINDILFVAATTIMKVKTSHHQEKVSVSFSEEAILAAKRRQMQILFGSVASNASHKQGMNVRVTHNEGTSNLSSIHKRKLIDSSDSAEKCLESKERAQKASRSYLDLNVPVEEIEGECIDGEEYDSDSISESSEAWLEDFLNQVDEKVVLKPFDFDALSAKIIEEINENVKKMLGPEVMLEIDYKAVVQILAAAWLSEEKKAMEDWVEQVLCKSFAEAHKKYKDVSSRYVIRLVVSEQLAAREQTSCVCLPTRINLN